MIMYKIMIAFLAQVNMWICLQRIICLLAREKGRGRGREREKGGQTRYRDVFLFFFRER